MTRLPASPMVATELTAALPPAPTSILDRVFPLDQCEELAWVPAAPIYGEWSYQAVAS